MTIKNNVKSEEELTCHFKIGMKNLRNFDPSTWKSQKFSHMFYRIVVLKVKENFQESC